MASPNFIITITILLFVILNSKVLPTQSASPLTPPQPAAFKRKHKPSLLRIDPTNILSTISKYSGLILPNNVEKDLQNLSNLCRCEEVYLDVLNRELEVRNMTVSLNPGDKVPALRVGRFYLSWDSYLKPCVEMELDDVDLLVEFWNLMLTRTNWHALNDAGFPPKTAMAYSSSSTSSSPTTEQQQASTFLRVGSIRLTGQITLVVQSRPLNSRALCPPVILNFRTLNELMERVRTAANKNEGGRRGCTTTTLTDIVGMYVNEKVKELVKNAAVDMAKAQFQPGGESEVVAKGKKLWSQAKETALRYAGDVKQKTEADFEKVVKDEVKKRWGLDEERMDSLVGVLGNVAAEAFGKVDGVTIKIGKGSTEKNKAEDGVPYKDWLARGYKKTMDRLLASDNEDESATVPGASSVGGLNSDGVRRSEKVAGTLNLQPDDIFFPSW